MLALGHWGVALGHQRFALGPQGFLDTNILVSLMEIVPLEDLPNAKPQGEWVCVLVEYRLNTKMG